MPGVFHTENYKELVLKCTQATTGAPATAYTLRNTFGQPMSTLPAWARTGTGVYTLTKAGYFTANKTIALVNFNGASRVAYVTYTSADVITITVFDVATPSAADSGDFDLIVRVYE